jgi:hypothetical protein
MSRKHATADRAAQFRSLKRELMTRSGLDETDPRLETACWLTMALDNVKASILAGQVVPIDDMKAAADALAAILPAKATQLEVHFIDGSDVCVKCKAPLPPKEEREPVKAEAPAPQPVPAPPTPAPAPPANVVALHKDIHAGARHN